MFKTLLLIIFSLQINAAHSEVYKWFDENGKIVYGDKPTSTNADKIDIKKKPKEDKRSKERYKKQQKLLDVMQEERDEKIASKKEQDEKNKKRELQCVKLKKELQETKDASRLYIDTDDPNNPIILTAEERSAEEQRYEKLIKENC